MKFFESDLVKQELNRMQDLYLEINKMGLMLTTPQKKEQLAKMIELINLQQTMYMRVTLSDDPDAKQMVEQVKNAATMLGMNPSDVNHTFYDTLRDNVQEMIKQLPT
jgi:Tat protein secretion system quality control protein TatD with DNase activity